MEYVELHRAGAGWQIRFGPTSDRDEPFVANELMVGPILGQLGVRSIGPWEVLTGDDGVQFQRALIIGLEPSALV